jgi:hypothetical protein
MTVEIIIVHPPDYNEQANLHVVSLLPLRKKDGLSMGFKHNRVLKKEVLPQMLRPIPQKLRIRHAILLH